MSDFFKVRKGLSIKQESTDTTALAGDIQVVAGKVVLNNGASSSPAVTEAHAASLTNKTIDSDLNTISNIVNANIKAGAAIAYAKLALTASIVNADIASAAGIAYSKLTLSNSILNADIASAAAIAYSKLALTASIVNADISASAAIVYAKLALTGSVVNSDISVSAAIAYGKLALSNSIVNADIASAAAIAYSKLNLSSSIVNADIASGAAIAISKINTGLTGSLVGTTDTQTVTNKTVGDALTFTQIASPASPAAGFNKLYTKSDNNLYIKTSAGTEVAIGGAQVPITLRYINTSGQSIPNNTSTTITNWTLDFDSTTAFNATTGVFTAPVAGTYMVKLTNGINSGGVVESYINKNGTTTTVQVGSVTNATDLVRLSIGETITFKILQASGTSQGLTPQGRINNMSITLVSNY